MIVLYHILIWLLVIYVLMSLAFYFLQDYFFFRPEVLPRHFQYKYPFPFEELHFDMEDSGTINGIYFKVPNSLGVVYYLKGNSRSVKGWGKFARDFVGKGYDFFMVDYRGFGKSQGKRNEQILYSDAQFIYKWLSERYDEKNIILFGRSFGSGIAARLSSWNNPNMLILDSPYYSFYHLTNKWGWWLPLRFFQRYKLPLYQFIKNANCPIHIIHGNKDRLIDYGFSVRLAKEYPDKVILHPIEGAKHNNLPDFPAFHDKLYEVLKIAQQRIHSA